MEWEDFRRHLGLTEQEENKIYFIKDNIGDLSLEILKLLNDLKQRYEMKPESINILKENILKEIENHKDEFEKYGYDIGYDDGYADGLNARKRK